MGIPGIRGTIVFFSWKMECGSYFATWKWYVEAFSVVLYSLISSKKNIILGKKFNL